MEIGRTVIRTAAPVIGPIAVQHDAVGRGRILDGQGVGGLGQREAGGAGRLAVNGIDLLIFPFAGGMGAQAERGDRNT